MGLTAVTASLCLYYSIRSGFVKATGLERFIRFSMPSAAPDILSALPTHSPRRYSIPIIAHVMTFFKLYSDFGI